LNYAATHPNARIRYTKSGMVLWIESDASYLSVEFARSRIGGYFYLSNHSPKMNPKPNGPLHVQSKILKHIVSSAAESEIGGLYENAKLACVIRNTLNELGYPQSPTPIKADNSTAVGFANRTIKRKFTKAIDMRFYWLRDRINQKQFLIYWKPGKENKADYFTKHHSPDHHKIMRPFYVLN